MRPFLLFFALALALTWSLPAQAGLIELGAVIDGRQEVPMRDTPARGSSKLFFDTDTKVLTITQLEFSGLRAPLSVAHIHGPAVPGVNASVLFDLVPPLTPGVTAQSILSPISFTLNATQEAQLLNELFYINIHSTLFPPGEIRGQIEVVPEPSTLALLATGAFAACGYGWRRRRASSVKATT